MLNTSELVSTSGIGSRRDPSSSIPLASSYSATVRPHYLHHRNSPSLLTSCSNSSSVPPQVAPFTRQNSNSFAYGTLPRHYPASSGASTFRPASFHRGPLQSSERASPHPLSIVNNTLPYQHRAAPSSTTYSPAPFTALYSTSSINGSLQPSLTFLPSDTLLRRDPLDNTMNAPNSDSLVMVPQKGCVACIVTMLDGSEQAFEVKRSAKGIDLFDAVCRNLDLHEKEYFGLMYKAADNVWCWLDLRKKIDKYMNSSPWRFDLQMKFYPPEPSDLHDELTRYLLCLQIRQDLICKKLPCSFATYILLSAYIIQSELGDYDTTLHPTPDYMKDMLLLPEGVMTSEMMSRIMELHKLLKGQRPDEADAHFLENAKKLSLYGVDFHKARDVHNEEFMIGVYHSGVLVYMGRLRINRFLWAKVIKITFLRCHFRLFLRHSQSELQDKLVEFRCESPKAAKRLWRSCVEHHAFFRLREGSTQLKRPTIFPAFSHRTFQFSGSTMYEAQSQQRAMHDTNEGSVTLRHQPRVNRQPASRLSWRARDPYITPTLGNRHVTTKDAETEPLDYIDFSKELTSGSNATNAEASTVAHSSPIHSSGATLPSPRVITSPALRQPPSSGSRIIRPNNASASKPRPGSAAGTSHRLSNVVAERPSLPGPKWHMTQADATPGVQVDKEGLIVSDRSERTSQLSLPPAQGTRANWGISQCGKYYYEVRLLQPHSSTHPTVSDSLLVYARLGWSTMDCSLMLGEERGSFAYGVASFSKALQDTANEYSVKMTANDSVPYGEGLKHGDVIGCYMDLNQGRIHWSKNGMNLGDGLTIPAVLRREAYYPACTFRNCILQFNFGEKPFLHLASSDWIPPSRAPRHTLVANKNHGWHINPHDVGEGIDLSADGLVAQARLDQGWQGVRTDRGIQGSSKGQYYFEVTPLELDLNREGGVLIGWSVEDASSHLGADNKGIGYGTLRDRPMPPPHGPSRSSKQFGIVTGSITDNKSDSGKTDTQETAFKCGDVIGCALDTNSWEVRWSINGNTLNVSFTIQPELRQQTFFPTATLRNSTLEFNFGNVSLQHTPINGSVPVASAPQESVISGKRRGIESRVKGGWSYVNAGALENTLRQRSQRLSQLAEESGESSSQSPSRLETLPPVVPRTTRMSPPSKAHHPVVTTASATITATRPSSNAADGTSQSSHLGVKNTTSHGSTGTVFMTGGVSNTYTSSRMSAPPLPTIHVQQSDSNRTTRFPHTESSQGIKSSNSTPPSQSTKTLPPKVICEGNLDGALSSQEHFRTEYTTVEQGEPLIETESFIAPDGSRVTRTVKRTRIVTKHATSTSRSPTLVATNDINFPSPAPGVGAASSLISTTARMSQPVPAVPVMDNSEYRPPAMSMNVPLLSVSVPSSQSSQSQHYTLSHSASPTPILQHHNQGVLCMPAGNVIEYVANANNANVACCVPTVPTHAVHVLQHSPVLRGSSPLPSCPMTHITPSNVFVQPLGLSNSVAGEYITNESGSPACGAGGIPTVITKTAYFCYHPLPDETNEEAMARLAHTVHMPHPHGELTEVTMYKSHHPNETQCGSSTLHRHPPTPATSSGNVAVDKPS